MRAVSVKAFALTDVAPPVVVGIYRDMRAQKNTEEELRERDLQFRQLAENIREVLWLSSTDYRSWIYVSPAFEEIWGQPSSALGGSMGMSTILPEDREQFFKAMPGGKLTKRVEFEYRIRRPDGSIRWVRTRAFPIKNDRGEMYRLAGISEDITDRKQVEDALRENERRYRLLTENATDIIWTTDLSLNWTFISPSVKRVRGYTVEEAMNLPVNETMTPESLMRIGAVLRDALKDEQEGRSDPARTWTLEVELYHKNGTVFWGEVTASFLRDGNGKPVGIQGITRDISARKEAEHALRESEERYRTLINNIPLGVYRTTPSGEIVMANPALLHLMGYESVDELRRRNLEQEGFSSSTPRGAFKEQIERDGYVKDMESTWLRSDGSRVVVMENARITRRADGSPIYYEGIVEDITERKKAEEALKAAERAREQFYRFLVHDLNKPLAAIIGFSSDLQSVKEMSPASRELADRIQGASVRLRNIVGQFLEIERIRRGEMTVRMNDFDLWKQVKEVVSILGSSDKSRGIHLAGIPAAEAVNLPEVGIHSDLVLAGRVVQNLVDNALKYGKSRIEIDVRPEGEFVILSVWNDGPHIPKEHHERIFAEFYQLPGRKRDGMGIGLAAVRQFMNALGGRIGVESSPEQGTAFLVWFPAAKGGRES
ncbi:PAS domain S-box protein [Candidatus Sumerlaeota bacterium]|nr:PAS domain S-box protein [Candidatus Sumerlaeota bacterium]